MKKQRLIFSFIILILLAGCQWKTPSSTSSEISETVAIITSSVTSAPSRTATSTPMPPSPTAIPSETPAPTSTTRPAFTPDVPAEARIKFQCLEVAPNLTSESNSSGVIILGNGNLLDLATGKVTKLPDPEERMGMGDFAVSPEKNLMAIYSTIWNSGRISGHEVIIATADGQRTKVIPAEEKWQGILGWTNDQRLILAYDEPFQTSDGHEIQSSYLILEPFSGETQILHPDLPMFMDANILQWWGSWEGGVLDPTLTRLVYPRFVDEKEDAYTLGLWDVENQRLVSSLENLYTNDWHYSKASPMPIWSPDGSQFVFRSQKMVSPELVEFELYRVGRGGESERLTHLTSIAEIHPSYLSWSPDNKHLAVLLTAWYAGNQDRVVVLDLETQEITDYCIPLKGPVNTLTVWSPDGKQFLIADAFDAENRRVILVDINQGFAVQIAEDMEPWGWMETR